jgi:hypothetical protein
MTPFWIGLLKRAMPVVIEAGANLYKQRSAPKQAHQAESASVDVQTEKLDALQAAVIRVATEMESISRTQVRLARAVTHLRWASLAALVLSMLALVLALSQYL